MVFAASRGGLVAILLVVGLLYFSGAGTWLWVRVQNLDDQCYMAVAKMNMPVANPVCGGLAKGIEALSHVGQALDGQMQRFAGLFGGDSQMGQLSGMGARLQDNIASMVSPESQLAKFMHRGPGYSTGARVEEQFQQAVDSFAIGKLYMNDSSTTGQAMPWLQRGAAAPGGFGLLSQLTLGSMYAQGGQGVSQDPQLAEAYLTQAKQSLGVLSGSNTPQSQQMLQTLPASPQELQRQIELAIQQLRIAK
ncbi:MAG: hypothetical protein V4735_01930 [Pseudomonadota bacterium]